MGPFLDATSMRAVHFSILGLTQLSQDVVVAVMNLMASYQTPLPSAPGNSTDNVLKSAKDL